MRDVSHPGTDHAGRPAAPVRERVHRPERQVLLRVFAKDCLWDFEPLEHFTQRIQEVDPEATGKPFATVEGLTAMKNGLKRAGIYAFFVIAAVLLLDFRSLRLHA